MFTGLIEALGTVRAISRDAKGARLELEAPFADELERGESVAVNGACLTAVDLAPGRFSADVSNESLARTTLGELVVGAPVNLERALAVGARLGGHYVLGHVDGVGRISKIGELGEARRVDVEFPPALAPLVVEKGSVTIDGISLTVNELSERSFWVAIIPETWSKTTLGQRRPGARVNLEGDILGKYVLRALATRGLTGGLTEALLRENGYL
jgi:riboflavin synthase